jgi:hypothetical protein
MTAVPQTVRWFTAKSNGVLFHALSEASQSAHCHSTIRPHPRQIEHLTDRDGLPENAKLCDRCKYRLAAPAFLESVEPIAKQEQGKPLRLTASQMWNHLTLLQREQILAWFITTYAPSRNAARFQLTKNPSLTHAESLIVEHWKGIEP